MRLIQCNTDETHGGFRLVLEEFTGSSIPSYAILSHTWGKDEVTFADVQRGTASSRAAFNKLMHAIHIAKADGYKYIWVDTCCIDKSSSAEWSEAINSMYKWYQLSGICYVYLEDLLPGQYSFAHCRWFTRGWCLQELLAPYDVIFYTSTWTKYGEKFEMCDELARRTGIDPGILNFTKGLHSMSIAQRMSWGSHRETTRIEDQAYCLMGIFSVNMPLLYGEGEKAFLRLQEEIIKTSDDHTIFAWASPHVHSMHGLLADSPAAFVSSGRIVRYQSAANAEPFQMTNRGLRIHLSLAPIRSTKSNLMPDIFLAALDCPIPWKGFSGHLGIRLQRISTEHGHEYKRIVCSVLEECREPGEDTWLYVRQERPASPEEIFCPIHYVTLLEPQSPHVIEVLDVKSLHAGKVKSALMSTLGGNAVHDWLPSHLRPIFPIHKEAGRLSAAILMQVPASGLRLVLMIGSVTDLEIGYDIITWSRGNRLERLAMLEGQFKPRPLKTTKFLEDISWSTYLTSQCRIMGAERREEVSVLFKTGDNDF